MGQDGAGSANNTDPTYGLELIYLFKTVYGTRRSAVIKIGSHREFHSYRKKSL
jgi:hypothetical protein